MTEAPVAGLFLDELKKRLKWFRGAGRSDWEISLAATYLEKRDYLRATIYASEAYITREVEATSEDISDFAYRDIVRKKMASASHDFKIFTYVRNSLAHGVNAGNKEAVALLADEQLMRQKIKNFIISFNTKLPGGTPVRDTL